VRKKFINKRRKNFFSTEIRIFTLLLAIAVFFYYAYLNFNKVTDISHIYIQKYSSIYDYNLINIELSNLNYINENEIIELFKTYQGKSIFLIPLKKIASEIRKNNWVKNLEIKSNYKNTLYINVLEEKPLGIYDNYNTKILFSDNLIILEILNNVKKYPDLITFYGENSINNSKKLLINIEDELLNYIESAIFIENRRWNIILNNSILLKLPEENIKEALNIYKKIYANLSNKELKDIEIIDLRLKNKAILNYGTN